MVTEDAWTLEPKVSLSFRGGNYVTGGAGIAEYNLFGFDKAADIRWKFSARAAMKWFSEARSAKAQSSPTTPSDGSTFRSRDGCAPVAVGDSFMTAESTVYQRLPAIMNHPQTFVADA